MIIRSLRLHNIRSYSNESLTFPPGRTLFEGDIGSGKSSLLMAIEFALFGLGSERGASLLKTGAEKGAVTLVFDVEGSEYTVTRTLTRKSGKVQQGEGEIRGPGGRENLSPTDMKEYLLKVLGFNEPPDPKSQSVIYRYAVYTPQEAMKEILGMPADQRLQTLRKAFGIEDYRVAKEHAQEISRRIGSLASVQETKSRDLPALREKIEGRTRELMTKRKGLASAQKETERAEKTVASLKDEMKALRQDENDLRAAQEKVTLLERSYRSKSRDLKSLTAEVESAQATISRLEPQVKSEEATEDPTPMSQRELSERIGELRSHIKDLRSLLDRTDVKIEEYRAILETGRCATCDRVADAKEFVEKERAKADEKEALAKDIEEHEGALSGLEELQDRKRDYEAVAGRLREHRERLAVLAEELAAKRARALTATEELEDTEGGLFKAKKEVELLSDVSERIRRLGSEIDAAEGTLQGLRNTLASSGRDVEHLERDIAELEEEAGRMEAARKRAALLKGYGIWIDDYFIPTLELIENQVLANINQDFNQHFQGWFSTLVEDQSKEARVDDQFVPYVEQDGYEQDADYLSGGERTSLALAYRLALNEVVQRVSVGMRSNLLILDEPTDGFSREQLGKMREILDEIESPQVILVSHDKELESFADQIFRVVKAGGESRVVAGA